MSDTIVNEYEVKESFVVLNVLFLRGDRVYIQCYDPVAGRRQSVFSAEKEFLGYISSKTFWDIKKQLVKIT